MAKSYVWGIPQPTGERRKELVKQCNKIAERAKIEVGQVFSFGQAACAPRGPEAGRGVSIPPSLPLDSTLPATS